MLHALATRKEISPLHLGATLGGIPQMLELCQQSSTRISEIQIQRYKIK